VQVLSVKTQLRENNGVVVISDSERKIFLFGDITATRG
jgi:hypothetical protein